jgi:2'-5' RNA ligase
MPGQLQLDLCEIPTPRRGDRLFFALVPDARTGRCIHRLAVELRSEYRLRGLPIPPERLHVSLFGLADHAGLPRDLVAAACSAAAHVREVAFEIAFDRIAAFGGGRAVGLAAADNLPEIRRFRESLGFALEGTPLCSCAERAARHSFTPHMTLLYDEGCVETRPIVPIRWRVRDFVLVHSRLGQGRHIHLGRWPLL